MCNSSFHLTFVYKGVHWYNLLYIAMCMCSTQNSHNDLICELLTNRNKLLKEAATNIANLAYTRQWQQTPSLVERFS